jgi:hypothetical protein
MTEVGMESDASPSKPVRKSGRGRRSGALALVVVASLLVFPAIVAIWVNRQALNTDNWTRTSTQLLQNRLIRDQLSTYLVDQLYANVDVQAEIERALPPRLDPLAGPAAGGLRELSERTAKNVLARPRAQQAWADANRGAHIALLKLLDGGGPNVSTEGGVVQLNLRNLVALLTERVGVGGRLQSKLPASAAEVTVLRSNQLDAAQKGLKALRGLPFVVLGLSLLLFVGALLLAPDRRRQSLRAYGVGFIAAGGAALLTRSIAGDEVVSALGTTASVQPAIAAAWTISTPLLKQAANATILYGVAMVFAAWLAGPTKWAVAARTAAAPYVRRPAIAYGVLAVVVVLLLVWGPTPATRNPALAVVLIVLMAIGTEVLRRQIVREHPEARRGDTMRRVRASVGTGARKGADWAREGAASGRAALAGTTARVTTFGAGGAPAADARIDQLERLGRLRDAGVLDDGEFRAQKAAILEVDAEAEEAAAATDGEGAPANGEGAPAT